MKKKSAVEPSISRDVSILVLLLLSAFTVVALKSFSPTDPSLFTATTGRAKNLAGLWGSHWASLLIQTFGAASYLFALLLMLACVGCFRKLTKGDWALTTINYLLLMVLASAWLGIMHFPFYMNGMRFPAGGYLGIALGGALKNSLNTVGATLVVGTLFLFSISQSLNLSVRELLGGTGKYVLKFCFFLWGACIFGLMNFASLLKQAFEAAIPKFRNSYLGVRDFAVKAMANTRQQLVLLASQGKTIFDKSSKLKSAETKGSNLPPLPVTKTLEAPAIVAIVPAAAPALTEQPQGNSYNGPEIITRSESSEQAKAIFDRPGEMEASKGESSSLLGFVKKAVQKGEASLGAKKVAYELPPISFLNTPITESNKLDRDELYKNSKLLEEKLADFNIKGSVAAVKPGPVVTMYEFKPAPGIKVNSVANLADDLALALSAMSIRIVAPIPGRDVIGIEVPNKNRESVLLKEIIGADTFHSKNHGIPVAIGKDILGSPVVADLKKMPHLLVAGTTGSGKSVFINTLICSLLYRFNPDEMRMILVDPKQLELAPYNDIPHLLLPVVTESRKASLALNWTVHEMERRYRLIAASVTRDLESYNKKLQEIGEEKMAEILNRNNTSTNEVFKPEPMPKIVVIIDELADLMMTAKSDVENNICRLAQKARAAGVHLVLATQRPSTDVITGLIKANLPSRLCFKVSSKIDSRVMFDAMGAEKLIGMGDLLFMPPGDSSLVRMHGAYISIEEVEQITKFWRAQGTPNYRDDILVDPEAEEAGEISQAESSDPLYNQALDVAYNTGTVSASYLQRRLNVGYNRAARFVEMMETQGIVGPADGSKPRQVLGPRP